MLITGRLILLLQDIAAPTVTACLRPGLLRLAEDFISTYQASNMICSMPSIRRTGVIAQHLEVNMSISYGPTTRYKMVHNGTTETVCCHNYCIYRTRACVYALLALMDIFF